MSPFPTITDSIDILSSNTSLEDSIEDSVQFNSNNNTSENVQPSELSSSTQVDLVSQQERISQDLEALFPNSFSQLTLESPNHYPIAIYDPLPSPPPSPYTPQSDDNKENEPPIRFPLNSHHTSNPYNFPSKAFMKKPYIKRKRSNNQLQQQDHLATPPNNTQATTTPSTVSRQTRSPLADITPARVSNPYSSQLYLGNDFSNFSSAHHHHNSISSKQQVRKAITEIRFAMR